MKYEINGHVVEADAELSETEIDEIAASIGPAKSTPTAPEQSQAPGMFTQVAQHAGRMGLDLISANRRESLEGLPAEPITPTSSNPLMAAIQAAGQTLKAPARISPTLSQPGQIAGERVEEALGGGMLGKAAGFVTGVALDPQTYATSGANKLALQTGGAKPLPGGPSNILFTPAELSGKAGVSGLEAALAKAPTGAPVIERFRALRAKNFDEFMDAIQQRLGTNQSASAAGNDIKEALLKELSDNKGIASELYKRVPQDARVSVKGLTSAYQELLEELPDNVKRIVRKHVVTDPPTPTPPNVGEFRGITPQADEFKIGYSASPKVAGAAPATATMRDLQLLRSKLGPISKAGGLDGFYATKLRQALDADIDSLATKGASSLDNMVGKETADSLRQATAYYREMKALENTSVVKRLKNAQLSDLPEIVFRRGRVEDVLTAKAAMGEGFEIAQRSFFNEILRAKNIAKELSDFSDEFLSQALTKKQNEALRLMANLQSKMGSAEKVAPMTGSARMNAFLAIWHGLSTNPVATVATGLALPYAGAKAYIGGVNTALNPARTGSVSLHAIQNFLNRREQ